MTFTDRVLLVMVLMVVVFVEQASSAKEKAVAHCGSDQGSFTIEAIYGGALGTFNVATTALGQDADAPEVYHLPPFLSVADGDLATVGVTFHGCFPINTLHRFVVFVDLPENNDSPPDGEYNLTVNGRQIISGTTQSANETFTEYLFTADSHQCDGDVFTLTIQFDPWPSEIDWVLENESNETVVPLTYESTLKKNSSRYTSEFDNALLFVQHCLVAGDEYKFSIFDEAGDGLLDPNYYEIASNGVVILRQVGNFRFSDFIFFQSNGTSPSVAAPSNMPVPISASPMSFPTDAPAMKGTSTPNSVDPSPPGFCFAGSTTVFVKGTGKTMMRDLKIGDHVAVGSDGIYEPVYSFGHYEPNGQATGFLKLSTNQTASLQISPDHLVFLYRNRSKPTRGVDTVVVVAVPVASVRVGDLLVLGNNNQAALVESIKAVDGYAGLYAPFTPSGKLLVNGGLLVSSFVGFERLQSSSDGGGGGVVNIFGVDFTFHWLSHSFEFPHRVACYYISTCPSETYTIKGGLSTWVAWPLEMAMRIVNMESQAIKSVILAVFVLMCSLFTFLEILLFQPSNLIFILLATVWLLPKVKTLTTTGRSKLSRS